jgi:hypothetical protein
LGRGTRAAADDGEAKAPGLGNSPFTLATGTHFPQFSGITKHSGRIVPAMVRARSCSSVTGTPSRCCALASP